MNELDSMTISHMSGLLASLEHKNHIEMTFNNLVKLNNKNIFDIPCKVISGFGEFVREIYGEYTITEIMKITIETPTKFNLNESHIDYAKMILKMIEDFKNS